nr:ABC transporter ATP-binding protein [uncultured Lachnoanaerobaculum sp.]
MNLSQNSEPILEAKDIGFAYDKRKIITGVNLKLHKNELVSLLGVSGSGKSTLFNIIAGLLKPDTGKIVYDREDITGKSGIISYSFQKDLLLPYLKIEENVALPLLIKKEKKSTAIKKAQEMLREFKLDAYANKYPRELSGGMRQRIALLRTYLFSKDLSLLDEPFSALDAITKDEMHEWYMNMRRRYNTSTIFITHDVDEAILLSDRIYILGNTPSTIKAELKIEVNNRNNDFKLSESFLEYKKEVLRNLENDGDGKKF